MEVWVVSGFLFWLMYFTDSMCYSNFNFAWIAYVFVFGRKHLASLVTCNHIATIIPWYSSWAIDPSIPRRMMNKYGWSLAQFALGDLVLHVMPTIVVISMRSWHRGPQLAYPGIYSLLLHLVWGVIQKPPFDVIRLYIPMSVQMCNLMWLVLVVSHVSTMGYLSLGK